MKNSIFKILIMLVAIILVTACEEEKVMVSKSIKLVGFNGSSVIIPESQSGDVSIFLGAASGKTLTVTLEVSTEGISSPAVEGTDFTLSTKTPELTTGDTEVTITTIDNDVFTGDKSFDLVIVASENYQTAAENTIRVVISDDEHPLKNWLGTYSIAAASYGNPGNWDESWTVVISPVAGELDQVTLVGISNSADPILATIDKDGLTISIESGQLYAAYGYDPEECGLYYATDDLLAIASGYVTSEMLQAAAAIPMEGTISGDGSTIAIDRMAVNLEPWAYLWDVFNTSWTKQ
jgi:hypothetical protein